MKAMYKNIFSLLAALLLVAADYSSAFAWLSGGRGVYLHGGWAGARYVASGMTGEVMADDVFSIYWNPAGLTELEVRKKLTEEEITEKAGRGRLDEITEEDLLNFSEDKEERGFFTLGISASSLDIERDAIFSGVAFKALGGVFGIGLYTIMSNDIETRDNSGALTGHTDYSGSAAYISYAFSRDIFSFGITLKGLHEQIGESAYAGAGADMGLQIYLLPFLKAGFMVRDMGSFLRPYDAPESEERYDFVLPQIKGGVFFVSDSGFSFSFCGSKKLEQEGFGYGAGVEYNVSRRVRVNAGIRNDYFSAGLSFTLWDMEISYAFSFDKIDYGYNNTVSAGMVF